LAFDDHWQTFVARLQCRPQLARDVLAVRSDKMLSLAVFEAE
jgi:hypothetical protein